MTIRVIQGDCREVMPTLDACSVDAIVTDPPYGLGFMGKGWDHGVPGLEFWQAALHILKPGGYLLAFGGTRTYHRLACAIEDAGFEIRDQIGWAFGSGFPKSHNGPWGGTALKPAWEPICMARKPLDGTVASNVEKHGTGALNIDACRIGIDAAVDDPRLGGKGDWSSDKMAKNVYEGGYAGERVGSSPLGRWPANLIHDGSEEVLAAFPDAPGQQRSVGPEHGEKASVNTFGDYGPRDTFNPRGDAGSAARFFYCAKADKTDREDGLRGHEVRPLAYGNQAQAEVKRGNTAHAGDSGMNTVKMRGNHHPTVKPTDLMRYLCRLVTPKGGTVLDPFMGSGSTLKAAELEGFSAIGIEIDSEYCEIARRRIASDAPLFADVA